MSERKLQLVTEEHTRDVLSMSDDELMLLSAAGRRDAFETLVARHYAMICATASQYLGDEGLGKDVAQDTFLSIWNHRRRYMSTGRFRSYLIKVMFNFCHMMARSHKADLRRRNLFLLEQETGVIPQDVPLDVLMRSEMSRVVQAHLVQLPPKERKTLLLRYGQGLSMVETADLMGIPVGTAKSHAARGLKRLHKKLTRRPV